MERPRFVVLVPVKSPTVGKSRLQVPVHSRPALATAFALDTLLVAAAAESVAEVVVVSDDAEFTAVVAGLGLPALPDRGGLNQSLSAAASTARETWPDGHPVALCADLPCLLPADLDQALASVTGGGPHLVADAEGVGTTMYAAAYDRFAPAFGIGSRAAHLGAGSREITGVLATLRHDVDDQADLAEARQIGVGAHTRRVLEGLRTVP